MRPLSRSISACLLVGGVLFLCGQIARVARAEEPGTTPALAGILVDPPKVTLTGPGGRYTLLVNGQRADGRIVDVTHLASFRSLAPNIAQVTSSGEVMGIADGKGTVQIEVDGKQQNVEIEVSGSQTA